MTPTTLEPHTVSQAVLRAWLGPDRTLIRYDLVTRKTKLVGTDGMGFTRSLRLERAPAFEERWKAFEDGWPDVRAAIETGRGPEDPWVRSALVECLAVHMARSADVVALHAQVMRTAVDASVDSVADDPRLEAEYLRERGIQLLGGTGRRYAARSLLEGALAEVEASPFTADAIAKAHEEARALAGAAGIELVTAAQGEFLIGDAPAQTLLGGSDAVGPLGGIPWRGSSTIWMPVTRRNAVALGPADDAFAVGRDAVDELNRRQSLAAHQYLAWHPDADLRDLADTMRAGRSPGRRAHLPAGVSLDLTMSKARCYD